NPDRIELDDLSLPANLERIEERLTLTSEKRADDPLFFASHPDFFTYPPDGPLRQISIQQMRTMKEHAQFSPLKGSRRVFLLDELDRANEQAANSLLKILEEPPPYLLLIGTVSNVFDLLPTIRSRSVMLNLNRIADAEVEALLAARGIESKEARERARLAMGCPGKAVRMNLEAHRKRAAAMLTLLEVAAGLKPFTEWIRQGEATVARKSERLEDYLETLLTLLQDMLHLRAQGPLLRHPEYRDALSALASRVELGWVRQASAKVDEMKRFQRRSAQKTPALDDLIVELSQSGLARR
ncbi:MAG: DNA polymerase III subunit delta', partial [Bryobacterales bacterium]|nr:DNA polymerase III subunit delta' [Bryobacterales bacterium]